VELTSARPLSSFEIVLRVQTEQLSLRTERQSERLQRNNGRKLLDESHMEARMNLLLLAGFLSLSMAASIAHADECDTKLTAQERATLASLTPDDQQTLTKMKMRDGSPATCEFRAGLLDMLANHPPENRTQAFHYLLKNTLAKQD
jgi:hypothetical protein